MRANPFPGAALAADLVNTRPRPASPSEDLDVAALLAAHGVPAAPEELSCSRDPLLALRADLLQAFAAADLEHLGAALNPHLARTPPPRLEAGELRAAPAPLPDRVAALAAGGLATLAVQHGLDRLGFCDADDCQCVYADTSPRGTRRYCSRTCATRIAVRRHRKGHGGL